MTTDRRFCRFNRGESTSLGRVDTSQVVTREVPEGGLCLSSFLVITDEARNPKRVLMGHLNPEAPWDHIGALDEDRVRAHSRGWMLPSSHLMIKESPHEAARRIQREQLGLEEGIPLSEPRVVSEVYTPKRFPHLASHWDLEFIFRGILNPDNLPQEHPEAWTELAFVDLSKTPKSEIARSHEDIIESAGLKFGTQE